MKYTKKQLISMIPQEAEDKLRELKLLTVFKRNIDPVWYDRAHIGSIVDVAFEWSETPQGHDFWWGISPEVPYGFLRHPPVLTTKASLPLI